MKKDESSEYSNENSVEDIALKSSLYAPNMYLLAFVDVVERLDILLLEVRHLQQSIIYLLRTPALYRALHYEDDYIFGNWSVFNKDFSGDKSSRAFDTFVSTKSVLRYPNPRKAIEIYETLKGESESDIFNENEGGVSEHEKNRRAIKKLLHTKVGEIWLGDQWVRELRRHYYALRSLQVLKQQIFRDKVTFFREAQTADLLNKYSASTSDKLPALMVLRSGIMFRINRYLKILQTHQQNFNKSVSYGILSFPRPITERRRQLGVFSDFLSETTVNLNKEMGHLLKEILPKSEINDHQQIRPLHIHVLHGWSPQPKVASNQLYDNIGRTKDLDLQKGEKRSDNVEDTYYIDSSFWSPDCPAHQPLITKEIASLYIQNLLDNMSDGYLSNSDSDLAYLMRGLFRLLNEKTKTDNPELKPLADNIHLLIRDLSKDFLAISIKGIPYIYSIFLANLGKGLEHVLMHQGVIRLDRLHELENGSQSINEYFSWYFRLRLGCYWMQQITHVPLNHIDTILVKGCREVCDELIKYLDKCTPSTREPVGYLWKRLADDMEGIIKNTPLVCQVNKWRKKRSKDKWNETHNCAGGRKYYRSAARLDIHLQNFLFRKILLEKEGKGKPLYGLQIKGEGADARKQAYINKFGEFYSIKVHNDNIIPHVNNRLLHPRYLFRHLYDIPFQCSIMRSIDFLKQDYSIKESWVKFKHACHYDMSLGRELFSTAMEFHIWGHESPRSRLAIIINLLEHAFYEKGGVKNPLEERMCEWMRGLSESKKDIKLLIDQQPSASQIRRRFRKSDSTKPYPAINIVSSFAYVDKNPNCERRLEQVCGYKLRDLLNIFKNNKNKKEMCDYNPMFEYLKIHDSCKSPSKDNDLSSERLSTRFYSTLLESFGDNYFSAKKDTKQKNVNENFLPERIPATMLNRIIASNQYPTYSDQQQNDDDLSLLGYFNRSSNESKSLPIKRNGEDVYLGKHIAVLGSHDGLLFSEIKTPCKCPVISISDEYDEKKKSFFTHFSLREIALSVKILPNESEGKKEAYQLPKNVIGTITISLNRREMRLNLLYRLYRAYQEVRDETNDDKCVTGYDTAKPLKVEQATIEDAIRYFYLQNKVNIQGFLTDGWGDLILVFQSNQDVVVDQNTVKNIFNTQQILYNEFMVDRTEVMLTPMSFNAAFKYNKVDKDTKNKEDEFQLAVHLRQQEDRRLGDVMTNLVTQIKKQAKNNKSVKLESLFGVPSNNIDLSMRLKINNNEDSSVKPYDILINWLKGDNGTGRDGDMLQNIDRMETLIENRYQDSDND